MVPVCEGSIVMMSGGVQFAGSCRESISLPYPAGRRMIGVGFLFALAVMLCLAASEMSPAGDLSVVPFFNGERSDTLNLWGGIFLPGNTQSVFKQTSVTRTGSGAYQAILGSVPAGSSRFFQTFSSDVDYTPGRRQDRNLTRYDTIQGYFRNDTGQDLSVSLELKDYRDSTSHRAISDSVTIPAGGTWEPISRSLDLSSGWTVTGSPDLSRTFAVSFLVDNDLPGATTASGSLYLDDFELVEKGGSIDVATAPMSTIVERLAHRQFDALWTARNKTSGIIPNTSDNVTLGALNTTTGVVWTLPSAIRHGWVTQTEADAYMGQLVTSLNTNRDQTEYLPTRFLDLVTASPSATTQEEESSIDAAFLALALHNYKSQPATPSALHDSIDALENRFDFSAFAGAGAFRQAYFQPTGQFGCCTYSGYTNENKVIALAAALSDDHNVPLANMWNKDVGRTLAYLVDPDQRHLVYSYGTQYRAPFVQALLNLFVDTSGRGADNYSNRALARNPWANFVRYENEVSAKLEQLGRDNFFQPDAGFDPQHTTYQPWNLYNNFGRPNVFQPWSVAEALMAGAPGAEDALRFLLDNGLADGLDGPLGLADSAEWATGAANPIAVPSFADNWNMTLSLMAFMEYLDGLDRASLFFANLPEVEAALDTVFIAGDYNGDGDVDEDDYLYWRNTFGSRIYLAADGNNDGIIDAADYTVWRDIFENLGSGAGAAVPEPGMLHLLAVGAILGLAARRKKHWKQVMKALA